MRFAFKRFSQESSDYESFSVRFLRRCFRQLKSYAQACLSSLCLEWLPLRVLRTQEHELQAGFAASSWWLSQLQGLPQSTQRLSSCLVVQRLRWRVPRRWAAFRASVSANADDTCFITLHPHFLQLQESSLLSSHRPSHEWSRFLVRTMLGCLRKCTTTRSALQREAFQETERRCRVSDLRAHCQVVHLASRWKSSDVN